MPMKRVLLSGVAVAWVFLALQTDGLAQSALPQPTPLPPAIAAPQDIPYPGTIRLEIDATDTQRRIFSVRETIPVQGGQRITLLYPQWLPGNHAPRGQIDKLAGLIVTAGGKRVEWVRDPVDVYAFHVDVPVGAKEVVAEFQFLSAIEAAQGRIVMTSEMLNLQWNSMALYPAGYYTRQIPVSASVKLPDGWKFGAALEVAKAEGSTTTFKTVSFEELVDAPMFAGRHFERIAIGSDANPVFLN
ncbi:MAG: peptidase M61, partial [Rhodospirillaceae bacterium]|nr:peptidase M61 [Rhodospirillaceae bacterium]